MKKKKPPKRRAVLPPHPNQEYLTIGQAALFMGIGETTVRRMISSGTIPFVTPRSGHRKRLIRVSKKALTEWLAKEERRGAR